MGYSHTTTKLAGVLLGGCVFLLGCHGLGSKRPEKPIAPLGNSMPSLSSAPALSHKFSERDLCIETASTVAEKGYSDEAVKLYEKAEGLDRNAEPLNLQLAPLYASIGDYPKSVERYQRAIDDGQGTPEVLNNFAWTLMEAQRYQEAVKVIERGLSKEPEHRRLNTTLAVTRFRMGDRQRSFETFEEVLGTSAAHHNLALLDLDAGNIDSAMKHADLAATSPDSTVEIAQLRDSLRAEIAASGEQTHRR